MALVRSALDRLVTVACFGSIAFALTACSTFSGGARVVAPAIAIGPPATIEPALPSDGETALEPATTASTTPDAAETPSATPDVAVTPSATPDVAVSTAPATGDESDAADDSRPVPETAELTEGMAQAREPEADSEPDEYDPWERFNEPMFNFNRRLDKYILKPVAKGYNFIVPDEIQVMISNGFDNISFVPRLVNSLLQGKVLGAGRELGRFLINSTAGVGGLFDPAKDVFGILKSREDFGQTLGVWGVGPGPYVIVPFLEPLTVRDGVGKAVDSAMDPLAYFLPLIWDRLAMKVGDIVNERSLNLDLFQGFEESVIDMYSAVRHAYLQRRLRLIRE
jgi:phospholipid-binding lipoprotein MlaA